MKYQTIPSSVGLPQINIVQVGSIPNGGVNPFGSALGSDINQWTYGYKDVATAVRGVHTIKFGGDFTRLYYLNNPVGRPEYTFFNVWDFLNDAPKEEKGNFDTVSGLPGGSRSDNRENLFGFFCSRRLEGQAIVDLEYWAPLWVLWSTSYQAEQFERSAVWGRNQLSDGAKPQARRQSVDTAKGQLRPQFGFNWSPGALNGRMVLRGGYGLNFNQEEIAITSNANFNPPGAGFYDFNSNDPASINPNIIYGISSSPTSLSGFAPNPSTKTLYNSNNLPVVGSANVTAFPSHLPTAYSQHYSLDIEFDFGRQLIASFGYQGSVSRHLITQYNENAVAAAQGLPLNPLVTNINFFGNEASSNNNALLASLKHQFSHQFSAEAQFAWAKSMDDGSGPYELDPYPLTRPMRISGPISMLEDLSNYLESGSL